MCFAIFRCRFCRFYCIFYTTATTRRFAGFDETVPESTRQALEKHRWLPLRHKVLKRQLRELLGS